jgi:CRP/FNR family transcriptional regulator, cyclic AMP receptor protein
MSEVPDSASRDPLTAQFGRRFSSGEVLFNEGEPGHQAFLLQQGRLRLLKRVAGRERSVRMVKPGDLFGECGLMPNSERATTAVAASDGLVLVLEQSSLEPILSQHPAVGLRVIRQLVGRLRDAEDQVEVGMLRDSRSKVVLALLRLAQHQQGLAVGPPSKSVELTVSPMDLSTRVGLDVDTVKRTVHDLREAGHLQFVGERVAIADLDTMRELYSLLGVRDQIVGLHRTSGGPPSP